MHFQGVNSAVFIFSSLLIGGQLLKERTYSHRSKFFPLTLLHSEWPKLYGVLVILSATGFRVDPILCSMEKKEKQKNKEMQKLFVLVKLEEKNREV